MTIKEISPISLWKIIKPVGIVNLAPEPSPVKTSKVIYLSLDLITTKKKEGHFGQMCCQTSGISSTFNVTKTVLHPTIG